MKREMEKKNKFDQLAVLSAGTFANTLTAILFFILLIGFFAIAFTPTGVVFDTYPYTQINISSIITVNNISMSNPSYSNLLNLMSNNSSY